jgi:hypothetical protein
VAHSARQLAHPASRLAPSDRGAAHPDSQQGVTPPTHGISGAWFRAPGLGVHRIESTPGSRTAGTSGTRSPEGRGQTSPGGTRIESYPLPVEEAWPWLDSPFPPFLSP